MQPKTTKTEELEATFNELAEQWLKATAHHSNPAIIARHPAYREIIAMGQQAVPFILEEMTQKRFRPHWFHALHDITGITPAPKEIWGKVDEVAAAWLKWGQEQGYCR